MSSTIKQKNTYSPFANSPNSAKVGPLHWLKDQFSPFRLLTSNIITIIFVVALSLLSYEYLIEGHLETVKHILETAFVSMTLLVIIPPLLYIFSYRPLLSSMHKLQQTESRLHLLASALECAEVGIVITDSQSHIQWINPAFAKSVNLTPMEATGQNLRLLESSRGIIHEQETRWQAILSGRVWKEELNIHPDNGPDRSIEQIITPVRDENGDISHFIFLEKDITEQRALEKTAAVLAKASQTLNRSLNLENVLISMLDLLMSCVPYDNGATILMDQDGQLLLRAYHGCEFEEKFQGNGFLSLADPSGSPHIRALLKKREIVLIPDTAVSPAWEPFIDGENSLSGLGVPFVVDNEVIGFCVLNKHQPNFFTNNHIEITRALVSQAGAAVQNARLFEQVQAGHKRLQALSHYLVNLQETERHFIARELHDEAGQALVSLKIQLLVLEQQANQPQAVVAGVAELKQKVENIAENLHRLATNLRPASLDHLGLLTALSQHVEMISNQHNLVGQFEAIGVQKRLPPATETAVYRIVQEALTNVVTHAQATQVDVILKQDPNRLVILVEDNGVGFDPVTVTNSQSTRDHLGLIGIRERAEMLGGTLIVESSPGNGSILKIEVPYDNSSTVS